MSSSESACHSLFHDFWFKNKNSQIILSTCIATKTVSILILSLTQKIHALEGAAEETPPPSPPPRTHTHTDRKILRTNSRALERKNSERGELCVPRNRINVELPP